jgi:hypothetical protein
MPGPSKTASTINQTPFPPLEIHSDIGANGGLGVVRVGPRPQAWRSNGAVKAPQLRVAIMVGSGFDERLQGAGDDREG